MVEKNCKRHTNEIKRQHEDGKQEKKHAWKPNVKWSSCWASLRTNYSNSHDEAVPFSQLIDIWMVWKGDWMGYMSFSHS